MSDIKEYYQPLYDATAKYQSVGKEIGKVKRCIDFLNDYINNKTEDDDLEIANIDTAVLETEISKNTAFRSFIGKNMSYFLGVGITYPILAFLGVGFPVGGIIVHIIVHLILLTIVNRKMVPDYIIRKRTFKEAKKCKKYLKKQKKENVHELLLVLYGKLNELRDEKRNLREYLSLADKQFLRTNNKIANEILESYGIDAEISIETSRINLNDSGIKKKKLK